MPNPIVTLTTDFGLKDPYVAEMKAVLLGIAPGATIVDVSHEIDKFNIRMGSYILASASRYFPQGTIHVAVVDPEVGTKRKAILIQTKIGYFVGPDNGVLFIAARDQGIEHIHEIRNPNLTRPEISSTFHGRDIFAPSAAHLAGGTAPSEFGPEMHEIVRPDFARTTKKKNMLIGEVLYIDSFGNIISNISQKELASMNAEETVNIRLKTTKLKLKLCRFYAETKSRKPIAVIGSSNFLEISINQGSAAGILRIREGNKITLYRS